ncbi:MAG: YIP1 family protein [Anaerolineae bacterium]|jgi:hypothetical protein
MGEMLNTLWKVIALEDEAFQTWRERPNIFVRGIVLIILVSLVAGLITFGINLVTQVQPFDVQEIREAIDTSMEWQLRFNPAASDPEFERIRDQVVDVIIPMVTEIAQVPAPLPQGISGFFSAVGSWLNGVLGAIGGWLFYGALVLFAANALGGSAKMRDFYGTVALYAVPGLLGLLGFIPCIGPLLVLVAFVWGVVIYVKATAVSTGLDEGRAALAVLAPAVVIVLLGVLTSMAVVFWFLIIF